MSNPIPSNIALSLPANGDPADATQIASDLSQIQVNVNELDNALSGGAVGQVLSAVDSTHVQWETLTAALIANAADKASAATQAFTASISSGGATNAPGSSSGVFINNAGLLQVSRTTNSSNLIFTATQPGAGETEFVFGVKSNGQLEWGAGGSIVRDTMLSRGSGGSSLQISSNSAGFGNLWPAFDTASQAAGTTYTPDGRKFVQRVTVTTAGTLTIAAPRNPPPAGQSAFMVFIIHNASGGTITLSWNAAFNNPQTAPPNGVGIVTMWVYNQDTSKWSFLSQQVE